MELPRKKQLPNIQQVIGIMSGKGGVGKSTVAVLLAQALASSGKNVGILDADITGPSIPRLLGIEAFKAESDGKTLFPVLNEDGIAVLSINLFNETEDQPVIWRGPLLGKAIEQFWGDAEWGSLDYLIIDFPPGTSDISLTAFQTIPLSGTVVVTTPQEYVSMIVRKSINMAGLLNTPVLGVVENMKTLICPKCGESISLFDDHGDGIEKRLGVQVLASLPWHKEVVTAKALHWNALPEAVRQQALSLAANVSKALAL